MPSGPTVAIMALVGTSAAGTRSPVRRSARSAGVALSVLLLVAVLAVVAAELRSVDWPSVLGRLDWGMAGVAAASAALSVLGAAWNLVGFSPVRLPLARATLAQVAGTALKVVTPASVGTVAVNTRVVQRSGAGTAPAVVAVAASQLAQLVVTLALVGGVAALGGSAAGIARPHVPGLAVLAALAVVVGLVLTRRWWWRLVPVTATARLADVGPQLLATLRSPRRCSAGLGGAVLLTVGLLGALWASIRATGGELPVLAVLVVLLAGSALGSTVPTPGGVGGVEAAMTAGLVAAGLPFAPAVAAVVVFRLLTFWFLVPAGLLAAAQLRRQQLV